MKNVNTKKHYIIATIISLFLIFLELALYRISILLIPYVSIIEYSPKISFIDDFIPMVSVFIIPYVLAYAFWVICPILIAKEERSLYSNFVIGRLATAVVGYTIQTLLPTSINRVKEGLYSTLIERGGFLSRLHYLFFQYFDPGDVVYGLLPSFHCITTIYCFLGVIDSKKMPVCVKTFFGILSILIVISTLFMKQHYFLDVIAGCSFGFIVYYLSKRFNWGKLIEPFLAKIDGKDN